MGGTKRLELVQRDSNVQIGEGDTGELKKQKEMRDVGEKMRENVEGDIVGMTEVQCQGISKEGVNIMEVMAIEPAGKETGRGEELGRDEGGLGSMTVEQSELSRVPLTDCTNSMR